MSQASPVSSEGRLTAGQSLPLYQETLLGVKSQFLMQSPLKLCSGSMGNQRTTWRGPGQCHRS